MSIEEQHVALPKLYGAPAYARPQAPVAGGERPFDPDELPIEALQTDEERRFAESLPARVWAPGGSQVDHHDGKGHPSGRGNGRDEPFLKGRPFNLRAIAGRLLGGD